MTYTDSKTKVETRILDIIKSKFSPGKKFHTLKFIAVNPPLIPEKPFDLAVAKRQGYYNFPPTGSMYLCASIDSLHLDKTSCQVIDLNNLLLKSANSVPDENDALFSYDSWKRSLLELSPANEEGVFYVFMASYMFGTTKECYVNTVAFLKESFKHSLIITGGVQATFDGREILTSNLADIVCSNEGEDQIKYLARTCHAILFENQNHISNTISSTSSAPGGISVLDNKSDIVESHNYHQPSDFDWDLSKYYDQIDISSYHKHGGLGAFSKFAESYSDKSLPFSAVLTKRGCRAHCSFCTVRNFNGKGLRLRSHSAVIDEIQYLYNKGIRHIDWLDDDLLYDEKYNISLFKEISVRFPDLIWTASNGLIGTAISESLMEWMSKSGLIAFKIGVESGNSQVIKDIRKPTTLWRLLQKSSLIKKYQHIFFSANFIVGFPGETFSQMYDSFTFARKLECDWSSFYVCQPLKGTDLYSSFQHLMDPRAQDESYTKTINPGRSAARGEFAYNENAESESALEAGWHIFDLDGDRTFTAKDHNEIWFTFNLVSNFFDNPCYKSKDLTLKLIHWLKAISSGYPFDASMTAALAHCYNLTENYDLHKQYKQRTIELIKNSNYWKLRTKSFPEILLLAGIDKKNPLIDELNIALPETLIPEQYFNMFKARLIERDNHGWKD